MATNKKKGKATLKELQSLCAYDRRTKTYTSLEGQDYADALERIFALDNKNDRPFLKDEIIMQPTLQEFDFEGKKEFIYTCELKAKPLTIENNKRKNERIEALNFSQDSEDVFTSHIGMAYIITCLVDGKEHIIKIGQTRKTFKERLGSYNCGVVYNWRTASTTNIKILQSLLASRSCGTFKLYLCDCSTDPYQLNWYGVDSSLYATPKSLAVEEIMLRRFIQQFGRKPLANIQTDK